ncbi:hypothetical protein V8C43DRAFT_278042 [Trichoderma afarasin]
MSTSTSPAPALRASATSTVHTYDTGTATVQRAPRHCCCSRSAVCSYPLSLSLARCPSGLSPLWAPESSTPDWTVPLRAGLGLDLHWRRCMIGHPGRSPINPDARRLQLLPPGLVILPCPPFISHGRFFLPPSSHSLVDQPALTFSSTNNPVASRPIVFEFLRPRRETFDALQCPAIALDAYENPHSCARDSRLLFNPSPIFFLRSY